MNRMTKHWGKWAVITLLIVFVGFSLGGEGCPWRDKKKSVPLDEVGGSAPPTRPIDFEATNIYIDGGEKAHDRIRLTWIDTSDNETGFVIERRTDLDGSWTQIATLGPNVDSYINIGLQPLTTYVYQIKAVNSSGDQGYSLNKPSVTTGPPPPPPDAPTGLIATPMSDSEIDLSWTDNSDNEDGFKIERSPNDISYTQIYTATANAIAWSDTGLDPETEYFYRVCAYNANGNSLPWSTDSATTLPPPAPDAPSNLTAIGVSTSQIDLVWTDNSGNETGFKIERSPDDITYAEITTVLADVTTYESTGLDPETEYFYRVCAFNAGGDSEYSNTESGTTQPVPVYPPDAPTNLIATAVSDSQIDLAWTDNSDNETGFAIERSPDGDDATYTGIGMVGVDVVSYSDTGLDPETTYWYRVKAYNLEGPSEYSNTESATTPPVPVYPPDDPSNLVATAISSSQIDLSWMDNSDDETGFKIERSPNDITYAEIATVAADVTAYSDTGLTPDTFYFYQVCAFNVNGDSGYSNVAETFTPDTLPLDPSDLVAATVSSSEIDLTWSDNSGNEEGFEIEYKITESPYVLLTTVNANTVSYSHTDLDPDTWYGYRVRAYNDIGKSEWSDEANATTDDVPPAAPTGLIATVISHSQIDIIWVDNADNETGFEIEVSLDETTWDLLATLGVDATTYPDTGLDPETEYFYRVYAFNAAGDSTYSNVASDTTPPAPTLPDAPTNLILTVISSSQIDLAWTDNADDETGFKIERSPDGTTYAEIGQAAANATAYSSTGLDPETEYFYRVCAFNPVGDSAWSNEASATTPAPPPPDAPTNLIATIISHLQIDLAWTDNSDNETGFEIEVSLDETTWLLVDTVGVDVTAYSCTTGIEPETDYYGRVRAINADGESAWSNVVSVTTPPAPTPPAAPTNLIATAISHLQIDLVWTDNSDDETGFKIEVSDDDEETWDLVDTVGADVLAWSDTCFEPETTYWFRVCAFNAVGDSAWSTVAEATTPAIPLPDAPTNLIATAISSSQIDLAWTDNSDDEECFEIERKTGAGGTYAEIATVGPDVVSYSDTGLSPETEYFYRVYANNAGGDSAFSNEASATTQAGAPPGDAVFYVFGGYIPVPLVILDTIFKYDPAAGTADIVAHMPCTKSSISAVWDPDNNVAYILHTGELYDEVEKFDPVAGTVEVIATLPGARYRANAVWDPTNKCAYIFGGISTTTKKPTNQILKFDPVTLEVTVLATVLPVANAQGCGAVWDTVNQCAYIFGGHTSLHYQPHNKIVKFDPAAGTAEVVATLPTNRNKGAAVWDPVNHCAYILGGHTGAAYLSDIVKFEAPDIVTANFSALPAGGTQAFHSAAWDSVNNVAYTFGGYYSIPAPAAYLDQITRFDPSIPEATVLGTKLPTQTYLSAACPGPAGPAPEPPDAPSNLIATAVSSSQIDLAWTDNSDDETGFKIERSPDGTTYAEIGQVAADVTTYESTGLDPETEYFYRVRASNAGGDSTYSNVDSATTQAGAPPPEAPTNLIATAISSSQIDLTWTDNSDDEECFEIERKTGAGGTYAEIATVGPDVTAYSDIGLTPETEYFYRVYANNTVGDSEYSNEASATTQAGAPPGDAVFYIFGGYPVTNEIVKVDVAAGTAEVVANLPSDRKYTSAVWDPDTNCAYTFGGLDDEIVKYDPVAGTAVVIANLPSDRIWTSTVWDPERGCAYIFGGSDIDEIVKFDPAATPMVTPNFATLPDPNTTASAVWDPVNKCAYIFGGCITGHQVPNTNIVKFAPTDVGGTAEVVAQLPGKRNKAAAVWDPINNCAYVFGGAAGAGAYLDEIVKFEAPDIVTANFSTLPATQYYHGAAWDSTNNCAYTFGGYVGTTGIDDKIFKFDPDATPMATTLATTLPTARAMISACPGQ